MRLAAGVRPALDPGVQVVPVQAERVEPLVAEACRLQQDPQHGVQQVVLAVQHLSGRQRRGRGSSMSTHRPSVRNGTKVIRRTRSGGGSVRIGSNIVGLSGIAARRPRPPPRAVRVAVSMTRWPRFQGRPGW